MDGEVGEGEGFQAKGSEETKHSGGGSVCDVSKKSRLAVEKSEGDRGARRETSRLC